MRRGAAMNVTEGRAVMHMALRAPRGSEHSVGGRNVVPDVHEVLDRIHAFTDSVREGVWTVRGGAGRGRARRLTPLDAPGGRARPGSPFARWCPLGSGAVTWARSLCTRRCGMVRAGSGVTGRTRWSRTRARGAADRASQKASDGRELRFLANVDPVDVSRALEGLDPATTMVVIVSKTFTTAETMLNARTVREWLVHGLAGEASREQVVRRQMVAVSADVEKAAAFGIKPENVFGFWEWVGGRYSVCSAVGVVPLALHYGLGVVRKFLDGAHAMDRHVAEAPMERNLAATMALIGVWNSTFLGHPARALLPYSQALLRFPAHIQQVDMESNGKRVGMDGTAVPFEAGEINFGEPGTNGQHSFYQLMHQGRVVPADFIGVCESQQPRALAGEQVPNHDELMSNFFAQPDALALGKTEEEVRGEGTPEHLVPHKTFPGNRPSLSLLLPRLDAFTCGQLLALYEHRTAVQGFVWGVCSFDQWGVELGKVLAKNVRHQLGAARRDGAPVKGFNPSTTALLERYLAHREGAGRK